MKKNKLTKNIYLLYTLFFCITFLSVFAVFIESGKGFICIGDGNRQHYIFLNDFYQIMRNLFTDGFPQISWEMGLGLDTIGQYSYYILGDPFAYISLLFPMNKLELAYNILIILRIYCVGLAFITYCKYKEKNLTSTLVGAIIYSFCGYVLLASIRHPYFTNAVILLPLNFLAIEKFLKENKKSFLIFIIFITAVCNYYFFYMITIINFIYAIIKYIIEYNKGIKTFAKKFCIATICYLIALLMASVIILPTVYTCLHSTRTDYTMINEFQKNFYIDFFIGYMSLTHTNWNINFVSSLIILMLPILFTKIKEKESRTYLVLFIITTLMLLSPFISSLMNGFTYPSNRWSFAYDFILSYIITICFDNKMRYNKKQILVMSLGLLGYCAIAVIITKFEIKNNRSLYISMISTFIMIVIIIINNTKKIKYNNRINNILKGIFVFLIIFNISMVAFYLYDKSGDGYIEEFLDFGQIKSEIETSTNTIENFSTAIEYIKQEDSTFYRIGKNGRIQ